MFAATRGVAGYRAVEFLASAISSGGTITVPAGVRAGDLLVMYDISQTSEQTTSSFPTAVVPSGFTSAINATNSFVIATTTFRNRHLVTHAVPTTDLGGTSITGMAVNYATRKILLCFRRLGGLSATIQDVEYQAPNGDSPNPTPQTVSAGSGVSPVVVCSAHRRTDGSLTGGTAVDNGSAIRMMYRIFNGAPSNCTASTAGDFAAPFLGSMYFNIT